MNTTKQELWNNEAEEAVLGSVFLDNEILDEILTVLSMEDFFSSINQKIFSIFVDFSIKKIPIDLLSVNDFLKNKNMLNDVGDTSHILYISSCVATSASALYYANIVKGYSIKRKLISYASTIMSNVHTENNVQDLINICERDLTKVSECVYNNKEIQSSLQIARLLIKNIEHRFNNKSYITGIPSGLSDLDKLTLGFQNSDLIVIAARPGMGKTALALNIAINVTASVIPTYILSLEMSKELLGMRIMSLMSKVPEMKIRTGYLSVEDFQKIVKISADLSELPLLIDDSDTITIYELKSKIRKIKKIHDIKLVIIDYLQLITYKGKAERRDLEVAEITRTLKSLAKEINIPIIILAQLNRNCEARINKRPTPADLRESGAIEQDADIVAFIYRDEVYNQSTQDSNVAEIIIAKNRNGSIGTAKVGCSLSTFSFFDLHEQSIKNYYDY